MVDSENIYQCIILIKNLL